ncbi:MAG: hypothetical protein CBD08_004450 [Cellvibrionales bacterium TMED148]|nr:MAG: hypothetical protein CBD08_004450 [Cellvibrionales bacterium TMED148]
MKKIILAMLVFYSWNILSQEGRTPSRHEIGPWVMYGVVANRVYDELYINRRNYVYMDRPYTEYAGSTSERLKGKSCVIDKRVYILTDRTIVQYIDQCDGSVIKESSSPR